MDYIYALKRNTKYDIKISLMHSNPEQLSMSDERYQDYMQMMRKPRDLKALQILHCIPDMAGRVQPLDRSACFATFETFEPPQRWIEVLNGEDAVICPSEFNVKIFRNAGVTKPIHHIPHCIDLDLYNPGVKPLQTDERFTFLFFSTWKKRKGYAQLLEAWMKEFDIHDNVRLLIKTDRYTTANKEISEMKHMLGLEKKELAPISFEGRVLSEIELPKVFKSADCLICPTLGEGFGLPGLQCMALGVPVAITNFSGCTDYANENTATLIEPDGHIIYNEMDGIAQFRNKKWSHITVDSVRSTMRYVLNNPEVIEKRKQAGFEMSKNFSYQVIAEKFKTLVESIT
jgi:glycosyltransferase involved in cell wall biosynthesis